MRPKLRAKLSLMMTGLTLGTLLVLASVGLLRAKSTVDDLTSKIVGQTSALIDEKIGALLDNADRQSKTLVGLAQAERFQDGLTDRSALELAKRIVEIMRANPEFSAAGVTLEATGEQIQVVQRPNGTLALFLSKRRGTNLYRQDLVVFGDELQPTGFMNVMLPDNREAGWYQESKGTERKSWTDTYLIRVSEGPETPGVTLATPFFGKSGQMVGVVNVDFTINDLSRFLRTVNVGKSGYAFLVERGKNGVARVIAHPATEKLLVSDGNKQRLATTKEFPDPAVERATQEVMKGRFGRSEGQSLQSVITLQSTRYRVGLQAVSGTGLPEWVSVVVVPEGEFMGSVWESGLSLGLIGLLSVALAYFVSLLLAQRVAEPLQRLAHETEKIRSLDLAERPMPDAPIEEIHELSVGMEAMKAGLRSFEKLVPADYARWLLSTGQVAKLGGERRNITTYFADIIGFTALSEEMEPEQLVEVLGEYLEVLSTQVLQLGGTIDKFNGDDVMAFWGAPSPMEDHALAACRAALSSKAAIESLHPEFRERGRPLMRASFGISTGDVVVGNVGSRDRMNYTVIGDAVNLASRLQGLNKYYSTEILVSERTVAAVSDQVVCRLVDYVSVAGRDFPIAVYELIGLKEEVGSGVRSIVAAHDEAMNLYKSRSFAEAAKKFETVLESWPHDGPARIVHARCMRLDEQPPDEEWDGSVQAPMK